MVVKKKTTTTTITEISVRLDESRHSILFDNEKEIEIIEQLIKAAEESDLNSSSQLEL